MKRVNGLQFPLNRDPVALIFVYISVSLGYFLLVATFVNGIRRIVLLSVSSALIASTVFCWYCAVSTNSEVTGTEHKRDYCFARNKVLTSRFCGICKKLSYGHDHHCVWLNNCIGAKNYLSFFLLVWSCLIQMTLQTAVGVLLEVEWRCDKLINGSFEEEELTVYRALVGIHTVVAGCWSLILLALAMFHTYLTFVAKKSTFEWMLSRRKIAPIAGTTSPPAEDSADSAVLEVKRLELVRLEKQQEAWQAIVSGKRQSEEEYIATGGGGSQSSLNQQQQQQPQSQLQTQTQTQLEVGHDRVDIVISGGADAAASVSPATNVALY